MPRVVAPRSSAGDGSGGTLHTYTLTLWPNGPREFWAAAAPLGCRRGRPHVRRRRSGVPGHGSGVRPGYDLRDPLQWLLARGRSIFPDGTPAERPLPKTPASRSARIPAYLLRDRARGPVGLRAQSLAIALRPTRLSAFLRPT